MAKQLQDEGCSAGRSKARRLMKQAGVSVGRPKRRPVPTDSRHGSAVAPNLLARQVDVEPPDQVWAGDITYLWTAEGWWSLATVLDRYSRTVVAWAMSRRIDAELGQEALAWRSGDDVPRRVSYITRIVAVNTPVAPIKHCWRKTVSAVV